MLNRFFRWLWYIKREAQIDPTPVDFPVGHEPLRFVFSNVDKAPQVIVWCHDHTMISVPPNVKGKHNEVELVTDKPIIAMGVMHSSPGALMRVFQGALPLMLSDISAYEMDVTRTYPYYVPRWRAMWDWMW